MHQRPPTSKLPERSKQLDSAPFAVRLKIWVEQHPRTIAFCTALILFMGSVLTGINWSEKARNFACNYLPGASNRIDCSEVLKPHEPVTTREVYEARLARFRIAAATDDSVYLAFLSKNGFRIQDADLCSVATDLVAKKGPAKLSQETIEIFVRSASKASVCQQASFALRREMSVPLTLVIFEQGLDLGGRFTKGDDDKEGGCGWSETLQYWPKSAQLVDALVTQYGAPSDLKLGLDRYISLFDRLEATSRTAYVEACANNGLDKSNYESVVLFRFSRVCLNVKRIVRLDRTMGEADIEKRAFDYCNSAMSHTDYAVDTRVYRSSLARWAK